MEHSRISKVLLVILIVSVTTVSLLYLLRPINDPDFFWHLKSGEWMWQHRTLLSDDPFSYTSPERTSTREHIILTSYWLSQLLYHLLYSEWGIGGIIFLRAIIAGILVYAFVKRSRNDRVLTLGLLLTALIILFEEYPLERPQAFSFVFFALLLSLLERRVMPQEGIKDSVEVTAKKEADHKEPVDTQRAFKDNRTLFYLPLLMLIWANMHGGFVLGTVIIVLYMILEGMKFVHPALRPMEFSAYKRLLIAGAFGIVCSLINPNTYHVLIELIQLEPYLETLNLEYQNTVAMLLKFNRNVILLYWFVLLLCIAGLLIRRKELNITEITLLAGTAYFSFTHTRYIPFFLIAALPFLVRSLSRMPLLKWSRAVIMVVALCSVLFFSLDERSHVKRIQSGNWINDFMFPVKAADFIDTVDLGGKMYNFFNWGGYLIWRFAPERKVFIDGRNLFPDIYAQSLLVENAYQEPLAGQPQWKSLLNAYGATYAVIPLFYPSGMVVPLVHALINDKDWIPVFFSGNSMILVKDMPVNYPVTRIYSIPKEYFIEDLIRVCNTYIKYFPEKVQPYIAKGDLYMALQRYADARDVYRKAIEIAPLNSVARQRLAFLDSINRQEDR